MKFTKFDIGADIISILTRGMYPDPKDALREYIQNGVDAKAKKVNVKIRQNNIIVEDNGYGMDHVTLRRAARIGVSDKNPSKDVGFMGIGIYSSYHLCDGLIITSKKEGQNPNRLIMDFKGMKAILKGQRDLRLEGSIDSDKLLDLQSLLEAFVAINEDGEMAEIDFPWVGTRVEMQGLSEYFYSEISDFNKTSRYLQEAVPLRFNPKTFSYSAEIEKHIQEACQKNNSNFEIIDLTLQVDSEIQDLYRPYNDSDFDMEFLSPKIEELHSGGVFFGVAWACLNSGRKKIKKSELRGFILKKQGFAIGKRADVVQYFPRSSTYFDRYIGEIIITNNAILPNASRNDIEYSSLRGGFISALVGAATNYDYFALRYQEDCKADADLDKWIKETKEVSILVNQNLQNSEILYSMFNQLSNLEYDVNRRIITKRIRSTRIQESKELWKAIKELQTLVKDRLEIIKLRKAGEPAVKKNNSSSKSMVIATKLNSMSTSSTIIDSDKKYENLIVLVDDLEFKYDENIKALLEIIDERFIQAVAKTKDDYYDLLESLKQELFSEED